jgi:hypothetical protein
MSIITDRDEIMNITERIFEIENLSGNITKYDKLQYNDKEYWVLKNGVGDINNNIYIYYILYIIKWYSIIL